MRNESWANYIKEKRKAKKLTRRRLASLVKIDPSYITLIERDGFVPRRDKVLSFASVLDVDSDEMLLMAGYAPSDKPLYSKLFVPELFELIEKLSGLEEQEQIKANEIIRTCLTAVKII